jgi:hypothetical protein
MLAAFIGQRVLWLLIGQQGLGHFFRHPALASNWHQDFASCVSIKTMPTILSEALAAS